MEKTDVLGHKEKMDAWRRPFELEGFGACSLPAHMISRIQITAQSAPTTSCLPPHSSCLTSPALTAEPHSLGE